jgi:hypothetical protein
VTGLQVFCTVACVLRSGGIYTPEWVRKLHKGLQKHTMLPFRFRCLTDWPDETALPEPWVVPLAHHWPKWWSKMELFRPGVFEGPVLYLDLDTLVVGDWTDLGAHRTSFAMISDFYQHDLYESGVMAWEPSPSTAQLYEGFEREAGNNMATYRMDGRYIRENIRERPERLNRTFEGQVVSLKVHARVRPPHGARLVCAHGKPKFHDPAAGWAHEEWRHL